MPWHTQPQAYIWDIYIYLRCCAVTIPCGSMMKWHDWITLSWLEQWNKLPEQVPLHIWKRVRIQGEEGQQGECNRARNLGRADSRPHSPESEEHVSGWSTKISASVISERSVRSVKRLSYLESCIIYLESYIILTSDDAVMKGACAILSAASDNQQQVMNISSSKRLVTS